VDWFKRQVVAWLDETILLTSSEERGAKQVRLREVDLGGGRIAAGAKEEIMSFIFFSCLSPRGGRKRAGKVEGKETQGESGTERAKVAQNLLKTRSSWFPALWVEVEGASVRSNVAKMFMNSWNYNFSGWMLKLPRVGTQQVGCHCQENS